MGLLMHWAPRVRAQWGIFSLLLLLSLVVAPPQRSFAQEADEAATEEAEASPGEDAEAEAEEPAAEEEAPPTLEDVAAAADSAAMAGHTAWMLTSSALVLFMT